MECLFAKHAALAQLAERLTRNEKVPGSIPGGGPSFDEVVTGVFYRESLGLSEKNRFLASATGTALP
jgi:hypothetical protein